jgi:hypothetical protein
MAKKRIVFKVLAIPFQGTGEPEKLAGCSGSALSANLNRRLHVLRKQW